jgi:predicted ribosome quality control (RQC) complex YloA/Tae2 family protein
MLITLDIHKNIEANASVYYEKAKKAKKKIEGATLALEKTREKIAKVKAKKEDMLKREEVAKTARKKEWYEKFRWFRTSSNLLVIGGRDATTNEIIIKKHTEKGDLVFHTDMAGSPFFVIKGEGKEIPESSIKETADATCTFSRAWKLGISTQSVFYVNPDQVTKEANSGEYLTKGAFMVRGKINCAIGFTDKKQPMCASLESVKKHCKHHLVIEQGDKKPSDLAKTIAKKLGGDLDDIIRALPSGGMQLQK